MFKILPWWPLPILILKLWAHTSRHLPAGKGKPQTASQGQWNHPILFWSALALTALSESLLLALIYYLVLAPLGLPFASNLSGFILDSFPTFLDYLSLKGTTNSLFLQDYSNLWCWPTLIILTHLILYEMKEMHSEALSTVPAAPGHVKEVDCCQGSWIQMFGSQASKANEWSGLNVTVGSGGGGSQLDACVPSWEAIQMKKINRHTHYTGNWRT